MARALGTDIAGVDDVDLFLSYADEGRSAGEAVMRSLLHEPGKLWWAPDSGYNLKNHLHSFFDGERIERAVQQQAESEERVDRAIVSATVFGDELRLQIDLQLTNNPAKVKLTLTIDQLGNVLNATVAV